MSNLEWLEKYSEEHKDSTLEKWRETQTARINQLRSTGDRRSQKRIDANLLITAYFDKYPCLRQPWGLELVRTRTYLDIHASRCFLFVTMQFMLPGVE